MKINIDYNSDLPMYEQIKINIKDNVLSGKLQFNDPLPSVRQLSKDLNVSTITIKRAYIDLEHEGFIYSLSGRGTFVNRVELSKLLSERNDKLIEEYKNKTMEIKAAGIDKEHIINIINEIYRG